MNWPRLITQLLSVLSGLIASGNLGRLTTADGSPGELAVWAGVPALLAAAGGVGQAFLAKPSGDTAKPGSPGHREACDSLYALAMDNQWERARRVIDAWQDPAVNRAVTAWVGRGPEPKPTTDKKAE
jgi:hypothetical protein